MLDLYNENEAYFVCGIINSPNVIKVVDGYAVSTNRGIDVLKYIAIPKYNTSNPLHGRIAELSKGIHTLAREGKAFSEKEAALAEAVYELFGGEN